MTKDQRIAALRAALARLSQQTKGYDEYSHTGGLHKIAHDAVIADMLAAPKQKPVVSDELRRECEHLFQNGGGKAQVRRVDGTLVMNCTTKAEATRYAYGYDEYMVLFRQRQKSGPRVYVWTLVKEATCTTK